MDNGRRRSERKRKKAFWWGIVLCLNLVMTCHLFFRVRAEERLLEQAYGRLAILEGSAELVSVSGQANDGAEPLGGTGIVPGGYTEQAGLEQVDRPRERTYGEILDRLKALGEEDDTIAQVAENAAVYPQKLLEALANNPEMADFAAHYLQKVGTTSGEGLTEEEKAQDFPLFLQWDPRWGYASYGDDSVIGLSGCGPTALSMVLWYLTGNEELTPDKIAAYSMENGYYLQGTGTAWQLMEDMARRYGIKVEQPKADERTMRQALDNGSVIICSVGPGDFTLGGHFIVIYGYTDEGFQVNDPNCVARSRRIWSWEELEDQIKNIWVFTRQKGLLSFFA